MRLWIHASVKKLFATLRNQSPVFNMSGRLLIWLIGVLLLVLLTGAPRWVRSSQTPAPRTIAFIPGRRLDALRSGTGCATKAAENLNCTIYWNAPTTEADVAGQISLIEKVVQSKYRGLILGPNHALALLVPVRRALSAGLPVVIVSAPLDLPENVKLGYIVNDDEKMGELAAAEAARLVGGKGPIALVGLTRSAPGITRRVRAAERYLASRYPNIRVLSRPGWRVR
jgi:ribose transport system substrate-binding protein